MFKLRKKQTALPVVDLTRPIDTRLFGMAPSKVTGLTSPRQARAMLGYESSTPLLKPTFLNP